MHATLGYGIRLMCSGGGPYTPLKLVTPRTEIKQRQTFGDANVDFCISSQPHGRESLTAREGPYPDQAVRLAASPGHLASQVTIFDRHRMSQVEDHNGA